MPKLKSVPAGGAGHRLLSTENEDLAVQKLARAKAICAMASAFEMYDDQVSAGELGEALHLARELMSEVRELLENLPPAATVST